MAYSNMLHVVSIFKNDVEIFDCVKYVTDKLYRCRLRMQLNPRLLIGPLSIASSALTNEMTRRKIPPCDWLSLNISQWPTDQWEVWDFQLVVFLGGKPSYAHTERGLSVSCSTKHYQGKFDSMRNWNSILCVIWRLHSLHMSCETTFDQL